MTKTPSFNCKAGYKYITMHYHSLYLQYLQETKENVKLLLQLADGFVAKGNIHAANIMQWCAAVDKRYKDFSTRMDKYRQQLEGKLGVKEKEVRTHRCRMGNA